MSFQQSPPSARRTCGPQEWFSIAFCALALAAVLACGLIRPAAAAEGAVRWGYLADDTARLTIADVAGRDFAPAHPYFVKGFGSTAHWLRAEIADVAGPALLSVGLPILDNVRLYTQSPDGTWTERRSGDTVPYASRPWQSPFLGFVLTPEEQSRPVFVRIASLGTHAASLTLRPLPEGIMHEHRAMVVHAAMFGLQLMAIAICLLLYLTIRDEILLGFVVMQGTWLASAFVFYGYASVVWPDHRTDMAYSVLGTSAFLVAMLFHLIVIARFDPAPWLLRLAVVLVAGTCVLVPLVWTQDLTLALRVRSISMLVFLLLMVFLAGTARKAELMPLHLVRALYWAYVALVLYWMLPLLGIVGTGRLAMEAVLLHGTVNLALILTIVVTMALAAQRKAQAVREGLRAAETDRAITLRTIETQRSLIRMLAHEVGTALSVIRFALAREALSDRNRKRVEKAIDGLDQTVSSLVDDDRIRAGAVIVELSRVDPLGLLRATMDELGDRRATLHCGAGTSGLCVQTDASLLRLIFRQLLDNATKYAAEGSPIRVDVTAEGDGTALFTFRNALRPGPQPDLSKLTDRYYRDPHVLSLPGTGVGLSLVKELSARLGARFDLSLDGGDFVARLWIRQCST